MRWKRQVPQIKPSQIIGDKEKMFARQAREEGVRKWLFMVS